MQYRHLNTSDYEPMLSLYAELDRMHVEARPDYFLQREDIFPREHFETAVKDPGCLLLGAFDENRIVGILRANIWEESGMVKGIRIVSLDDIYVHPDYRRQGIAREFFSLTEAWGKQQGAVRMDLHVWGFNQDALALYEAMGMRPQRYVMEKSL